VDTDLLDPRRRRWRGGRREKPFRFLLDGRLFQRLCRPGQEAALGRFRASLTHLRLAPEGALPALELTPLAIVDVLGLEVPRYLRHPHLSRKLTARDAVELGFMFLKSIGDTFEKAPQLAPEPLAEKVADLRQAANPAAHDLFDLCLTRLASQGQLRADLLEQLAFDALFTYRFPDECRDRMNHLFRGFLLRSREKVPALSKVRLLKAIWDRSLDKILRKNPTARGEILALDQEMKPRTFKDFLEWEAIHYAVLGIPGIRGVQPVIAFTTDSADRLRARCQAHKTALRSFLDDILQEELRNQLRPYLRAWAPGWLVPCQEDGTCEPAISTGEVRIWAGPPPAPAPRVGELLSPSE
jgi:hypothetical protein